MTDSIIIIYSAAALTPLTTYTQTQAELGRPLMYWLHTKLNNSSMKQCSIFIRPLFPPGSWAGNRSQTAGCRCDRRSRSAYISLLYSCMNLYQSFEWMYDARSGSPLDDSQYLTSSLFRWLHSSAFTTEHTKSWGREPGNEASDNPYRGLGSRVAETIMYAYERRERESMCVCVRERERDRERKSNHELFALSISSTLIPFS